MPPPTARSRNPSGPSVTPTLSDRRDLWPLDDALHLYGEQLRWPVAVEVPACRVTVTTGETLDAVVMPGPLGTAVLHGLVGAMLPAVVIETESGRWHTFLTVPRADGRPLLSHDLHVAQVRLIARGTPIRVPIPGRPEPDCRWIIPPRHTGELPPPSVVLALARWASAAIPACGPGGDGA